MDGLNLNQRAAGLFDQMRHQAGRLGVVVHDVSEAVVIDAGVDCQGSLAAGALLARLCMADLAQVHIVPGQLAGFPLPQVAVAVDQPVAACLASQYAGWQVQVGDYFAMGSGPMRAIYGKEPIFERIGLLEGIQQQRVAVGVLETRRLPTPQVVADLAGKLGCQPAQLRLVCAPTASLAGEVQIVARSVETTMHKLNELGFDLSRVISGLGQAPLPPVAGDDLAAIGRTNDAILYGAAVVLYVTGDDDSLIDVGQRLPSSGSRDYGSLFADLFAHYDHDFYKIDPMLFSPACVVLQNVRTGRSHRFGKLDESLLARSFGLHEGADH